MTTATNASGGQNMVASDSNAAGIAQDGNLLARTSLLNPVIQAPGVSTEILTTKQENKPSDSVTTTATTQLSEKDARHASKKINEEIEKRFVLSKKFVERDREAIYDIAQEDPDLADRLLKEFPDFEVSSAAELLEKKELGGASDALTKKVTKTSSEVRKLQEELKTERVLRLKEKHPDLKDDLEEEFSKLYSDDRFSDKTPEQLLSIARALTGNLPTKQDDASGVALEMLKQNEGVQTTVRGSSSQKASQETASQRAVREAFGHTEEDFKKYLPADIDQILGA